MEALRIILRIIHIASGTFWVGAAIFITLFLEPTVHKEGASGGRFMERLVTETPFIKYMTLFALLTVITGVTLYGLDSRLTWSWIVSRQGVIFTIGSLAGLVAYVTGQFLISPTAQQIGALGHEMAMAGGPPSSIQLSEMTFLQGRASRFGKLELVLMVISVIGMAGARII